MGYLPTLQQRRKPANESRDRMCASLSMVVERGVRSGERSRTEEKEERRNPASGEEREKVGACVSGHFYMQPNLANFQPSTT